MIKFAAVGETCGVG